MYFNMARFSRRSYELKFFIWKLIENKRRRRMPLFHMMSFLMMRKKILLNILLSRLGLMLSICSITRRHRSCRRLHRNPGWWPTVWKTYSESRFKKTLRVSRKTYQHILEPIRHRQERKNINE